MPVKKPAKTRLSKSLKTKIAPAKAAGRTRKQKTIKMGKTKVKPVEKPKPAQKPKITKASKMIFEQKPMTEIDKSVDAARAELKSEFHIKIENVVSFAVLGVDIQLERLVTEVENTEYEPEQFPGLVYRTTNPRAAALIFSSGKIVCTGAKSIDSSLIAMNKVADTLRGINIPVPKKFPIEIENIVASSKIDAKLNLEEIAFMLENAEYEPEQFPGLVYRITEPRVAFLLFSSGKIIITGGRSIVDVLRALAKFKEKLEEIGIEVKPSKD